MQFKTARQLFVVQTVFGLAFVAVLVLALLGVI